VYGVRVNQKPAHARHNNGTMVDNSRMWKFALFTGLAVCTSLVAASCAYVTIGPDESLNGHYGGEMQTVCRNPKIFSPLMHLLRVKVCKEKWVQFDEFQWKNEYYWTYGRGILNTATFLLVATISFVTAVSMLLLERRRHQHIQRVQRLMRASTNASGVALAISVVTCSKVLPVWFVYNFWFGFPISSVLGLISVLLFLMGQRDRLSSHAAGTVAEDLNNDLCGSLRNAARALFLIANLPALFVTIPGGLYCVKSVLYSSTFFERNDSHENAKLSCLLYSTLTYAILRKISGSLIS
jgi:hypothetical protein